MNAIRPDFGWPREDDKGMKLTLEMKVKDRLLNESLEEKKCTSKDKVKSLEYPAILV